MIGAVILGLVAGVVARLLVPFDAFRQLSGPVSWLVSLVLGLVGAMVGYVLFRWLGIGDADVFDLGGIVGAVLGAVLVLAFTSLIVRILEREGD